LAHVHNENKAVTECKQPEKKPWAPEENMERQSTHKAKKIEPNPQQFMARRMMTIMTIKILLF
jgi:hypothetical protein